MSIGIGDHVAENPEDISYYIIIETFTLAIDKQALVDQPQEVVVGDKHLLNDLRVVIC